LILAIPTVPLQVHFYSEALPTTARILCQSFTAEAQQTTASEGLAQGPYMAARVGFEPMTLRTKFIKSANEPSRSTVTLWWWHHNDVSCHETVHPITLNNFTKSVY